MLDIINRIPLDELTDAILGTLHCGHDSWSRLRLHKLVGMVPPSVMLDIHNALPTPAARAAAMRYFLRGLTPDRAVMKVLADVDRAEAVARERGVEKKLAAEIAACLGHYPVQGL